MERRRLAVRAEREEARRQAAEEERRRATEAERVAREAEEERLRHIDNERQREQQRVAVEAERQRREGERRGREEEERRRQAREEEEALAGGGGPGTLSWARREYAKAVKSPELVRGGATSGREKRERSGREKRCIICFVLVFSFSLHSSSFLLPPSSFLLPPLSSLLVPHCPLFLPPSFTPSLQFTDPEWPLAARSGDGDENVATWQRATELNTGGGKPCLYLDGPGPEDISQGYV